MQVETRLRIFHVKESKEKNVEVFHYFY